VAGCGECGCELPGSGASELVSLLTGREGVMSPATGLVAHVVSQHRFMLTVMSQVCHTRLCHHHGVPSVMPGNDDRRVSNCLASFKCNRTFHVNLTDMVLYRKKIQDFIVP
jgi:hypothetical protein